MVGFFILAVSALSLVGILGILLGSFFYKKWKWSYGGFRLNWSASRSGKRNRWLSDFERARRVFDRVGASYGFWKKGNFVRVASFMQVEVVDDPFLLNGATVAGATFPGQKSIKVSLTYPINGKNVLMGTGDLFDGALMHEWMHFAYEYLYGKFDYNHEQKGDGLNVGVEGCWTPDHDMCIHEVMEELKSGATE